MIQYTYIFNRQPGVTFFFNEKLKLVILEVRDCYQLTQKAIIVAVHIVTRTPC